MKSVIIFFRIHLSLFLAALAWAAVPCNETSTCTTLLREGSTCWNGYCTNPFARGCLHNVLKEKIRTCNSDDADAVDCIASPLNYQEVRIVPNNWESAMFYAWILQILLSEVLDVPSTIETLGAGPLSFYDQENGFAYPSRANAFEALYRANEVGDCRLAADGECAHVLTEVWAEERQYNESAVDAWGAGMLAFVGWFVPKFVVEEDASLTHYSGYAGETNRQKLADMFKRPVRWIDYCQTISLDNCTTPDSTATRPPSDSVEGEMYFSKGSYTGHFASNGKNDCALDANCTGHMVDYPCTWSAYTAAQLHWNGIAMDTDDPRDGTVGEPTYTSNYTYSEILQVIDASNATRSPIVVVWWYPEPTMELYEFERITLPRSSRECYQHRAEPEDRCTASKEEKLGEKVGACGYKIHIPQNYHAVSFRDQSDEMPEALRSPAYNLVRKIEISDVDFTIMMNNWAIRGIDKWNYDPREAVCTWVAENLNEGIELHKFLPPGYPRTLNDGLNSNVIPVAFAFGLIGTLVSMAVGGATHFFRMKKPIKYAQVNFLYFFVSGYFLICTGAMIYGIAPTAGSCSARVWFTTVGFTVALVPLLVKIMAINKLMNKARAMQRTQVSKKSLYQIVVAVVLAVMTYLIVWTAVDPPTPEQYAVLDDTTHTVDIHFYCTSDSVVWEMIPFIWESALMTLSVGVAFVSRNVPQAFNESKVISNITYTIFLFLVVRLIAWYLPLSVLDPSTKSLITSLLLTLESLIVEGLYFGPKLWSIYKGDTNTAGRFIAGRTTTFGSAMTSSVLGDDGEFCPLCNNIRTGAGDAIFSTKSSNASEHDAGISRNESTEIAPLTVISRSTVSDDGGDNRETVVAAPVRNAGSIFGKKPTGAISRKVSFPDSEAVSVQLQNEEESDKPAVKEFSGCVGEDVEDPQSLELDVEEAERANTDESKIASEAETGLNDHESKMGIPVMGTEGTEGSNDDESKITSPEMGTEVA